MTTNTASFVIAHALLDDTMPSPAWTNLGCWQQSDGSPLTHYAEAAEQLAARVGAAAITCPGQYVVDLGCGQGASLLLWQQQFATAHAVGLELQATCVETGQAHARAGISLHQGRFDQLPLPEPLSTCLPPAGCDAVVCVDAAYHADSLGAFTAVAQKLLRAQGRLAFTTVLKPPHNSLLSQLQQHLMTGLSGIPKASFVTARELEHTLTRLGFEAIHLEVLDTEVLQGFADFVTRRSAELPTLKKRSMAWLKIAGTAALCRHWFRRQKTHYVLVSAQRTD